MHKIFITRTIPNNALARLKEECAIFQYEKSTPIGRNDLLKGVHGVEGLFTLLTDRVDEEVMDASPSLRVISNCAAGFDNIDISAATERGIVVTNTPAALTEATADITWALLLDAARRVTEGDRMVRRGEFKGWDLLLLRGVEIHGKTIGVIGAGRIGTAVARRAKGFGMRILYNDAERNASLEKEMGAEYVSFDTLLRESDFVTLHTPLTPKTKGLFGQKEFEKMKKTGVFINAARGKCHDEKALYRALKGGTIFAAGLDVYEEEPKIYAPLLKLDNIVLSPHLGSATTKVREEMAEAAVDNLLNALNGKRPKFVVNPEVLD